MIPTNDSYHPLPKTTPWKQGKPSNRHNATLNVDLPDSVRAEIFKRQRINAAFAHAKHAARMCATQIVVRGWDATLQDVESRMASYLVHKPLREYATKLAFELAQSMRQGRK